MNKFRSRLQFLQHQYEHAREWALQCRQQVDRLETLAAQGDLRAAQLAEAQQRAKAAELNAGYAEAELREAEERGWHE